VIFRFVIQFSENYRGYKEFYKSWVIKSLNINPDPAIARSRLHPRMSNAIGRSARTRKEIENTLYKKNNIGFVLMLI
jgi:hypothetical protein